MASFVFQHDTNIHGVFCPNDIEYAVVILSKYKT